MSATEVMIEEALEQLLPLGDNLTPSPRESDTPVVQPWKSGGGPETAQDADWLFEILMA